MLKVIRKEQEGNKIGKTFIGTDLRVVRCFTGSIATAWALYYDESLTKLFKNVLHHFKVPIKN